jgi:hypothetical protein
MENIILRSKNTLIYHFKLYRRVSKDLMPDEDIVYASKIFVEGLNK